MENRHCCIIMFHVFMVAILCLSVTCQVLGENLVERQVIGGIEAVRLVDGPSSQIGRLEVFIGGVWGTVCDDYFNRNAAKVVCRSLGFQGSYLEVGSFSRLYPVTDYTTPILLDNVLCIGNESSLNECHHNPIGDHNCDHAEDVGVRCGGIEAVRLVDGPSSQIGRLEVFIGGVWGTVCDDYFNRNAAKVVCRSLGFQVSNIEAPVFSMLYPITDNSTTPILLDQVRCAGYESSLNECYYNPIGEHNNCVHAEDVGVRCKLIPTVDQVRLVNGSNLHEGRVEVLVNGTWGTVCDDGIMNTTASVICRMLGFEPVGAEAIRRAPFGRGTGPILLDDVRCNGDESTLSDCVFVTHDNCDHSEDVGVRCG